MKIEQDICTHEDCWQKVRGIKEQVACVAGIHGEKGEYEYNGHTDVNWDSQNAYGCNGFFTVIGECGHEWQSKISWSEDEDAARK